MSFRIVRNDISKVRADAIVMSANPEPICGDSCDLSIYNAAGFEEMLKARQEIGPLATGEVAVSPAFALPAKYVFHTVGPVWKGGESGELLALCICYQRNLEKALELGCKSIAFPLISSGVYQFPKDKALSVAIETIRDFLQINEMDVVLVVYDRRSFELSQELRNDVRSYIDENYIALKDSYSEKWNLNSRSKLSAFETDCGENSVLQPDDDECSSFSLASFENLEVRRECAFRNICTKPSIDPKEEPLEKVINHAAETFQQKLFSLIQNKKFDDVDVYKKANLDRKHFSKIRSDVHYSPKKKTAIALSIALQLNLDETKDLLSRAGYALSPSNKGDLIVSYFISHQKYDIWEINTVLFKYGQTTLGA